MRMEEIKTIIKCYYPIARTDINEEIYLEYQQKRLERCKQQADILNLGKIKLMTVLNERFTGGVLDESILNPDDPSIRISVKISDNPFLSIQIVRSLLADFGTILLTSKNENGEIRERLIRKEDLTNQHVSGIYDWCFNNLEVKFLDNQQLQKKYTSESKVFDFKKFSVYELIFGSRFLPIDVI